MFSGKITGGFVGSSAKPMVGTLYAHSLDNSLEEATITTATQLVAGDPVVALVTQASQPTGQLDKWNPDNRVISAKATTATGGANSTDVCGFLLVNSNDRVSTGGVGIPSKGQRAIFAPLGRGAIVWLEVASQNKAGFQANLDTNVGITIDTTNGGVKVETTTPLKGAKVVCGLTEAVKIKFENGIGKLEDCYAVAVQLL